MDINDILTPEERKVWQDPDRGSVTPKELRIILLDMTRLCAQLSQELLSQLPEQCTPPKENDPYIPLAHR
jgi:hypothetical protein